MRELRLAVVLYGGVSLAIYMHGTTKELHRLVKASALEDAAAGADAGSPSEGVYRRLLREMGERDPARVRTRVVVDVIAGTSAGGINGVYLAKALAHNLSQDQLRDVWLRRGDVGVLLRGPRRIPWGLRAPAVLARARTTTPLDGESMSRWMYEALEGMDAGARPASEPATLMPDDHLLELFVTATDFAGYERQLVLSDPRLVHDEAHRHVLRFAHDGRADDFAREDNGWLAFAARVTSSFPGAFGAVSPESFEQIVRPAHRLEGSERFFRVYELSDADARSRYFVDGGVLDNRPFDHVVTAIRARRAELEVDRRLIYLEPDPNEPPKRVKTGRPGPIATVLGAVAGIPRKQPILDEILEVSRHNERVGRIRDIIEMAFADVERRVTEVVGDEPEQLVADAGGDALAEWSARLNDAACDAAGIAHPTYLRSKVSAVVERYSRTVCELSDYPPDCNQAAFVRSVLRAWARGRLFTREDGRVTPQEGYVEFLRTFDLDYGARRIRFLIAALSWWYEPDRGDDVPSRAELDRGKAALYDALRTLEDAMAGRGLGTDLTRPVRDCFERRLIDDWPKEPADYAETHAEQLTAFQSAFGGALDAKLEGFGAHVFEQVRQLTAGWSARVRRDLLVRYLGFPFWDAVLFPIQSVADAGERDAIDVVRFSPADAKLLADRRPKLAGASLGHFGAFFDRDGRERDYLLGRLDGAERLIGMLLGPDANPARREQWCREAFAAIAAEERDHLHVDPQALLTGRP